MLKVNTICFFSRVDLIWEKIELRQAIVTRKGRCANGVAVGGTVYAATAAFWGGFSRPEQTKSILASSRAVSSLTTIYTSTDHRHQHKIQLNFRSILEIVKQISECVGKLNVTDINADRSWLLCEYLNSTADDFHCRAVLLLPANCPAQSPPDEMELQLSKASCLPGRQQHKSCTSQPSMFYKY